MPTFANHTAATGNIKENIEEVAEVLEEVTRPIDHDEIADIKFLADLFKISKMYPMEPHARFLRHYLANIIDAVIKRKDGLILQQKIEFNTCIEGIRDLEDALRNVAYGIPPTADNEKVVLKISAPIAKWYKHTTGEDPKEEAEKDAKASAKKELGRFIAGGGT